MTKRDSCEYVMGDGTTHWYCTHKKSDLCHNPKYPYFHHLYWAPRKDVDVRELCPRCGHTRLNHWGATGACMGTAELMGKPVPCPCLNSRDYVRRKP